jgi:hypothetical protein
MALEIFGVGRANLLLQNEQSQPCSKHFSVQMNYHVNDLAKI